MKNIETDLEKMCKGLIKTRNQFIKETRAYYRSKVSYEETINNNLELHRKDVEFYNAQVLHLRQRIDAIEQEFNNVKAAIKENKERRKL